MTVPGISQETTFKPASSNPGQAGVTFTDPSSVLDSSAAVTFDAPKDISAIEFKNPNRSFTFDTAKGVTIDFSSKTPGTLVIEPGGPTRALAADPFQEGWNYQSFGVWYDVDFNQPPTGSAGGISIGATTPAGSIPVSGTATFKGVMAGAAIDDTGYASLLSGPLTVNVDFGARSASLQSGPLTKEPLMGGFIDNITVSGTLTYSAGQNDLTGTLTTTSIQGALSGTATARFYGPAAQEFGGVFALTAPEKVPGRRDFVRFVGAFGAAKGP